MTSRFISRNGRVVYSDKREFERLNDLPYGVWTCADGREVLFNRFYEPILQRATGQAAAEADPAEWVDFVKQEWLYDDAIPEPQKRKKAAAVLAEFMKVDA